MEVSLLGIPVIAGYGVIPIREYWDKDVVSLAINAVQNLVKSTGLKDFDAIYVGNMLSKYYEEQASISVHLADELGLEDVYALDVECGDASGAYAVLEAIKDVLSGESKIVLAGGVEKSTDELPHRLYRGISLSEDIFLVDYIGLTNLVNHAIALKMYIRRYNVDKADITYLSVLDHENASKARHAYFRFPIKLDTALNSPPVADPLTLFDISPNIDGAAFLLITTDDIAKEYNLNYVKVLGYGYSVNRTRFYERFDPTTLTAAKRASQQAFKRAGINTSELDFIEIHDSTTIAGVLALESIGVHGSGTAAKYIRSGVHRLDGELPINTFGGLKARGNPLGATGAYAIAEGVMQILGEAGDNQVKDAKIGLIHSMNGFDLSSIVFILGGD